MLVYKIDVLKALKEAGYNTTRLRKEKLISEATIQMFRRGEIVATKTLNSLCFLLEYSGSVVKTKKASFLNEPYYVDKCRLGLRLCG